MEFYHDLHIWDVHGFVRTLSINKIRFNEKRFCVIANTEKKDIANFVRIEN